MFVDHSKLIMTEKAKAEKKYNRIILASVTHEFRTPLNSMQANVNALLENPE